jgi:hypothetical protein
MPEEINTPSERTLDDIPEKVTKFLGAVRRNRNIRRALFSKGLTKDIRLKAWGLLKQVIGETGDLGDPDPEEAEDKEVTLLITELDQLDEGLHRVLAASLEFNHPAQFTYLLGGLAPGTKMGAVLGLNQLTKRIEAVRDNTDPKRQDPNTHAADLAALATISQRGYDDAFWRGLRLKLNRLLEDIEDPEVAPAPDAKRSADRPGPRQAQKEQRRSQNTYINQTNPTPDYSIRQNRITFR